MTKVEIFIVHEASTLLPVHIVILNVSLLVNSQDIFCKLTLLSNPPPKFPKQHRSYTGGRRH